MKLLDDSQNRDTITLLILSNLPALEKKLWVSLLPEMTVEEKDELQANLRSQIDYEDEVTEKMLKKFITSVEAKVAS